MKETTLKFAKLIPLFIVISLFQNCAGTKSKSIGSQASYEGLYEVSINH